jgi:spore coat protein U-like protein
MCSTVHAGKCNVSTTSINFGSYDVFSSAANTSTGSITLSCSSETDVKIAIGASSQSGSFSPRSMHHAVLADTLDYNIYIGATRTQVWGDGTHGTTTVNLKKVKNNTPPVIVYGKIEPLQNVSTGNYSDQVIVTIIY